MNAFKNIQNLTFTGTLRKTSATTKGSVLVNDGTSSGDFDPVSPTSNKQHLILDSTEHTGVRWGDAAEGISAGFPIPNGDTPNIGGTEYFLVLSSGSAIPAIPVSTGRIVFFSVRPDNKGSGWDQGSYTITGGTFDYTFGYIEDDDDATVLGNFTAYSGGPHVQIDGSDIESNNFLTRTASLDITVTGGQQICIKLDNNLTGSGTQSWTEQNAYLILRF